MTGTISATRPPSAGVIADTPADGWTVAAPLAPNTDVLLCFLGDAGGDAAITVSAGDRPPSQRTGLPMAAFAVGATEVKWLIVDKSVCLQDNGTIVIIPTDAGTKLLAFTLPKVQ